MRASCLLLVSRAVVCCSGRLPCVSAEPSTSTPMLCDRCLCSNRYVPLPQCRLCLAVVQVVRALAALRLSWIAATVLDYSGRSRLSSPPIVTGKRARVRK